MAIGNFVKLNNIHSLDTKIMKEMFSYLSKMKVEDMVLRYPKFTVTTALLTSYAIPRIFDPTGSQIKRPLLKRFFTITLPDNFLLVTLIMIRHTQNLADLGDPPTLLASLILAGGACKVLELTRTVVAYGFDKLSFTDDEAKHFAEFIGPRDFYAQEQIE